MSDEIRFTNEGMTESERQIHTPGVFAKENLLYVQEIGRLKSLSPHKSIREGVESFLFLLVISGKGTLSTGGKEYRISMGDCAFIDCMDHYEHISDVEDAWRLGWIHFNGKPAKAYHDLFIKINGGKPVFRVRGIDEWNARLGEIIELQNSRSLYSEFKSGELLLRLVNQIVFSVEAEVGKLREDNRSLADSLREYLNTNYPQKDIIPEAARRYGVSESELYRIFENVYRIGIEDYIESRRINAAKFILRFSLDTAEQVAKETGIRSVEELDKLFKKWEGISPEEYRSKWAGWIR